MRSRQVRADAVHDELGITSACAEQTKRLAHRSRLLRDHLRVCGADSDETTPDYSDIGSPPRVRSRPIRHEQTNGLGRITSACAEQTQRLDRELISIGDHLRVCGADSARAFSTPSVMGSPPRVRSRLPIRVIGHQKTGITSACAEQTISTTRTT